MMILTQLLTLTQPVVIFLRLYALSGQSPIYRVWLPLQFLVVQVTSSCVFALFCRSLICRSTSAHPLENYPLIQLMRKIWNPQSLDTSHVPPSRTKSIYPRQSWRDSVIHPRPLSNLATLVRYLLSHSVPPAIIS